MHEFLRKILGGSLEASFSKDYSVEEILSKVSPDCRSFVLERINSYFPDLDERVYQSELRRTVNHGKGPLYLRNRLRERKLSSDEAREVDYEVWLDSLQKAMEKARRNILTEKKYFNSYSDKGSLMRWFHDSMKEVEM